MPQQPPVVTIRQRARRYRIDPEAALAVARGEGGLVNREGDIGDLAGGGSYGPFQLYAKGALPQQYRGNPQAADAWAWSPAGIDYALSRMGASGAAGLTGAQAVEAIVRKFERPADPDTSVRNAIGRLGTSVQPSTMRGGLEPPAAPAGSGDRRGLALQLLTSRRQGTGRRGLLEQMLASRLPSPPDGPAAPLSPGAPPVAAAGGDGRTLRALLGTLGLDDAITGGERTVERNRQVGGSATSYHLPGDNTEAYDLDPGDTDIPALLASARRNPGQFKELFGPMPWQIKNGRLRQGKFPDHDDHYHVAR